MYNSKIYVILQHDRLVGARNAHNDEIKKHEKELTDQKFRNIDEEHRKLLIELKTTDMAHTDLDKYYKALEK